MEQKFVNNKAITEILDEKGFYKDLNGYPEITHQNLTDWLYEKGISLEIYSCSDNGGKSFNHLIPDYYLGSGTTAVVCKELKRNFIGCDINPKAIEITNARLEALHITNG